MINFTEYTISMIITNSFLKDRPKYKQLLKHAFIKKYEKEEVDVGAWYRDTQRRLNGSRGNEGPQKHRREDPLRSGDVLRGKNAN